MEQGETRKSYALLWWLITIILLTVIGILYKDKITPLEADLKKIQIVSSVRIHLLEAIEAEKNAVLAVTDEESKTYADEARSASNKVENARRELAMIIQQSGTSKEQETAAEFNSCWTEFRKLDEEILELATQNTNLKAQKLSSTQFYHEVAVFEKSLRTLIQRDMQHNRPGFITVYSYESITAILQLFALHEKHIEEADDREMDLIERRMKDYFDTAKKALQKLHSFPELRGSTELANAESAYKGIVEINAEVVRLSRLNTNIKSSALSLGKKRLISAKCQEILGALQATIESHRFKATR
jgi:chemoreceptor-like protein with four helix bundle sensory module